VKVLVTGAQGATGAPVLAALAARMPSAQVVKTDLRVAPGDDIVPCDLTDGTAVRALVAAHVPTRVVHLAGTFSNDFAVDHACNVLGTRHLLEALRHECPQARVLLVGSAAEYGLVLPEHNPVPETHAPAPVSIYGLSKLMQAELMAFYHRAYGLPVLLARAFNLVGPGLSPSLLPGRLEREIQRVKSGEATHVELGALQGQRDFLSVHAAAAAYARILEHGQPGQIYNVGSGRPTELRAFVMSQLAAAGLPESALREGSVVGSNRGFSIWADVSKLEALPA
jgi:GDP-4-dehydro-6-deoxy-D-mannose reductase